MMTKRQTKHEFEFDRVFDAECDQATVFEEISQLVQVKILNFDKF